MASTMVNCQAFHIKSGFHHRENILIRHLGTCWATLLQISENTQKLLIKEHVYNIRKHRCIDLTVSIDSNKNHWCILPVHVSSLRAIFQTLRTGDNSDDSTHKVAQHVPRWRIRMFSGIYSCLPLEKYEQSGRDGWKQFSLFQQSTHFEIYIRGDNYVFHTLS
jgi:hypothetical protein